MGTPGLHLAPLGKGVEPDSPLNLHTRGYRPPPPLHLPHTHAGKAVPSRTPDRLHSKALAASSVKSGKAAASKAAGSGSYQHNSYQHQSKSGRSSQRHMRSLTTHAADRQYPELSSSKLATVDTLTFYASPRTANGGQGQGQAGVGADAVHLSSIYPEVLTNTDDCDDLSVLPKPKRILPRRDVPWVFRFKVKKEMNVLSKIMASKPNAAVPPALGS